MSRIRERKGLELGSSGPSLAGQASVSGFAKMAPQAALHQSLLQLMFHIFPILFRPRETAFIGLHRFFEMAERFKERSDSSRWGLYVQKKYTEHTRKAHLRRWVRDHLKKQA